MSRNYATISTDPKEAIRNRRKQFKQLFPTPDDLAKAVESYFDNISTREYDEQAGKWQTIFHTRPKYGDLAAHLGLSEQTMLRMRQGNGGDEMAAILDAAITLIQAFNEDTLHDRASMAGAAFTLKQTGWADQSPIMVTANVNAQRALSIDELQSLLQGIPTTMGLPEGHTEVIINDDN